MPADGHAASQVDPKAHPSITLEYLRQSLTDDGLPDTSAEVVLALVAGRDASGRNPWSGKLMASGSEVKVQWQEFSGNAGKRLLDTGTTLRNLDSGYSGLLVQISGPGWDGEWRVLTLKPERVVQAPQPEAPAVAPAPGPATGAAKSPAAK